jgi:hypothetical protein
VPSGRSSGVEHNLAKVGVVSSNLIARSIFPVLPDGRACPRRPCMKLQLARGHLQPNAMDWRVLRMGGCTSHCIAMRRPAGLRRRMTRIRDRRAARTQGLTTQAPCTYCVHGACNTLNGGSRHRMAAFVCRAGPSGPAPARALPGVRPNRTPFGEIGRAVSVERLQAPGASAGRWLMALQAIQRGTQ